MKTKLIATLLVAMLCLSATTKAQSNIVKINLAALALVNISIQDEYSINGNSSVALGLSYLPTRGLPSVLSSKDSTGNIAGISFKGFSITPEYRYYVAGNGPEGFYIAGYFRYADYTLNNFYYNYTNSHNITQLYGMSGDWKVTAAGLMIGAQWKLGDNFVFDWWIIGGAFGKNGGSLTGTGPLSAQDQADFKKNISDVNIPTGSLTYSVTPNSVTITYDTGVPAIRGAGLCFGYLFGEGGGHHRSYHRRR